jgi:putative membrane protein
MPGLLLRMAITAAGLALADAMFDGISFASTGTLLGAALLLGLVNAVVRPLVLVLTFPITLVTLGAFLFVINAAMLALVAQLLAGFEIASFWSALFGSVVVSFTSWVASWYIGPQGRYEVIVARRTQGVDGGWR